MAGCGPPSWCPPNTTAWKGPRRSSIWPWMYRAAAACSRATSWSGSPVISGAANPIPPITPSCMRSSARQASAFWAKNLAGSPRTRARPFTWARPVYAHLSHKENILMTLITTAGPLVETDWLAEHTNDPDVRVIEVDVSPPAYTAGHIDGGGLWNAYKD